MKKRVLAFLLAATLSFTTGAADVYAAEAMDLTETVGQAETENAEDVAEETSESVDETAVDETSEDEIKGETTESESNQTDELTLESEVTEINGDAETGSLFTLNALSTYYCDGTKDSSSKDINFGFALEKDSKSTSSYSISSVTASIGSGTITTTQLSGYNFWYVNGLKVLDSEADSEGNYTLKVTVLYTADEKSYTQELTSKFKIAEEYAWKSKYSSTKTYNADEYYFSGTLYYNANVLDDVTQVEVKTKSGTSVGKALPSIEYALKTYPADSGNDYRVNFNNNSYNEAIGCDNVKEVYYTIYPSVGTIPTGNLDSYITTKSGTTTKVEDTFVIKEAGEIILDSVSGAWSDDNYSYLSLTGKNLDVSKLTFEFKDLSGNSVSGIKVDGETISASNGLEVRFTGIDKTVGYSVTIKDKSGITLYSEDNIKFAKNISSKGYYDEESKKLIVYGAKDVLKHIADTAAANTGTKAQFTFNDKTITPTPVYNATENRLEFDAKEMTILSMNSWVQLQIDVYEVGDSYASNYYYVGISIPYYASLEASSSGISLGNSISAVDTLTNVRQSAWVYTDDARGTNYNYKFVLKNTTTNTESKIEDAALLYDSNDCKEFCLSITPTVAGSYEIDAYSDESGTSSIIATGTFTITDRSDKNWTASYIGSPTWDSADSLKMYVETPYTENADDYEVLLYDIDGNKVDGITTTVLNRYCNSLNLKITGLTQNTAAKIYYVKVNHKTLGAPLDEKGTAVYSDEKGELVHFYKSSASLSYETNTGYSAVYMSKLSMPVKFYVYSIKDGSLALEKTITETNYGSNSFCFTKNFLSGLDLTKHYDLALLSNNGSIYTAMGKLSTSMESYIDDSTEVTNSFSYTVSSQELMVGENAIVTVSASGDSTYTAKNPTFSSSATNVATITPDSTNKKTAKITAVAPGKTTISVKFGTETKTFDVTVTRNVTLKAIGFNTYSLGLFDKNVEDTDDDDTKAQICVVANPDDYDLTGTVTYKVSDETVATVTPDEKDSTIATVQALKPGSTTVTATYKDENNEITTENKLEICVYKTFTQEEIDTIAKQVDDLPTVITNKLATGRLCEVSLPENWYWWTDSQEITADANNKTQFYKAYYYEENATTIYTNAALNVATITGIKLSSDTASIASGTTDNDLITLSPVVTGADITMTEFFNSLDDGDMTIDLSKAKDLTVTRVDDSYSYKVVAGDVTKDTTETVKFTATINGKAYSTSIKIKICAKPLVDGITIADVTGSATNVEHIFSNTDGYSITVDAGDISTAKNAVKNTIDVTATTSVGGVEQTTSLTSVKWASSDTSVATVKAKNKAGEKAAATITIKKAGKVTITATANDSGKCTSTIFIAVNDYTPVLASSTISMNYYATAGTSLGLIASYGKEIKDAFINPDDTVAKELFTVAKSDSDWKISVKSDAATSNFKKAIKTKIRVNVSVDDETKTYDIPITIKVDCKAPTVTFKNTSKANLFYKDTSANFTVSSNKGTITGIALKDDVTKGFTISYSGNTLTASAIGLTKDTLSEFKAKNSTLCKVPVTVTFSDYKSIDTTVTVPVTTIKPSYSIVAAKIVGNATSVSTNVIDKSKSVIDISDSAYTVVSKTTGVTATKNEDGSLQIAASKSFKKYNVEISNTNWLGTVVAVGSVTTAKAETLKLSNTTVLLNWNNCVNGDDNYTVIDASFVGSDSAIKTIEISPKDARSANALKDGYIAIKTDPENGQIKLGTRQDTDGTFAQYWGKTFKFTVDATNEAGVAATPVALTVKSVNKDAVAKLTGKGKINAVDPTSYMTFTASISNITANVAGVSLDDTTYTVNDKDFDNCDSRYFEVEYTSGNSFKLYASDNYILSTKKTYKFYVDVELDTGITVYSLVSFKVVNSNPKVTVDKTPTLYKTSQTLNTSTVSFISANANATISEIEVVADKTSAQFDIEAVDGSANQLTIAFKDSGYGVKPGKYTISTKVYFDGQATGSKPSTVKFTVVVK